MNWKRMLAYVTGSVDEELLALNEYLVTENRILRNHITNAVTEGLNSKIQSLKSAARGFRSFRNYRIRILFFCGKLNLYPL